MVGGALAIDKLSVENALKELKKEQERTAIRAVIAAESALQSVPQPNLTSPIIGG